MVARQETHPGGGVDDAPTAFRAAVSAMHAATLRPEVLCEQMPAPQRIAPWSSAVSADVTVDGVDTGTGRLILLHDPAGHDAWDGTWRCVAYARADIDPEQGADPLLAEVGWSWLTDALEAHEAAYSSASGTVTCVRSEGFGQMADDEHTAQVEIRASWTPLVADGAGDDEPPAMAAHVEAWGELLCTAVGLEPVPEGVTPIPSRRGQRG